MSVHPAVTKTGNHTTGELLFFAYYTEAPLIVPDDVTCAMLRERGYNVLSATS